MNRRRPNYTEPFRCVCEPGAVAHPAHGRPGAKAPAHLNPKCPHSTLLETTKPAPKPPAPKRRNLRVEL